MVKRRMAYLPRGSNSWSGDSGCSVRRDTARVSPLSGLDDDDNILAVVSKPRGGGWVKDG